MTDKQIIIDGVDVSGCIYYDANADKESYFLHDCKKEHAPCWSCSSMPSCLYKKYKRKEQECDELKKIIDEAKNSKLDLKSFLVGEAVQNEYEQQLDQLKAENDEYIKDIEYLKTIIKDFTQEVVKLKATLTDIKEIAQYDVYTSRTDLCLKLNWIKKKISECEGNDE